MVYFLHTNVPNKMVPCLFSMLGMGMINTKLTKKTLSWQLYKTSGNTKDYQPIYDAY